MCFEASRVAASPTPDRDCEEDGALRVHALVLKHSKVQSVRETAGREEHLPVIKRVVRSWGTSASGQREPVLLVPSDQPLGREVGREAGG